jgi:hypothetical protein
MSELNQAFRGRIYLLRLDLLTKFSMVHEEPFEDLDVSHETANRDQIASIEQSKQAFIQAFYEGLVLFFSPFTGFWFAVSDLHFTSPTRDILQR